MQARVVDVEAFAVENACQLLTHQMPDAGADKFIAIVDFGASTTTFSVLKDLKVIYTRDFAFGGQQLTEEIMRTYGLSMEDAGRAKKEGGLPSNYQPEVLDAFIDDMSQQVSRSLQFFLASGSGREQPDQILICGGCANIPGVADVIGSRVGVTTQIGDPLGPNEDLGPRQVARRGSGCHGVVDRVRPRIEELRLMPRINLLPWRTELRQRRKKEFLVALAGTLIVAAGVVYVSKLTVQGWTSAQQGRNEILRGEIAELDKQIAEITGLESAARAPAGAHAGHHAAAALAPRGRASVRRARQRDSRRRESPRGRAARQPNRAARRRPIEHARLGADAQHRRLRVAARAGPRRASRPSTAGIDRNAQFKVFAQAGFHGEHARGRSRPKEQRNEHRRRTSLLSTRTIPAAGRCRSASARSPSCSSAVVAVGIYMFVIKEEMPLLERAQQEEVDLRAQFEDRQRKAANFDAYRAQLAEIERDFGAMLRQLPGKTEVPSLLVDISQTGLGAGLEEQTVPADRRDPEGLLCRAADQAPLYRQLPRARQFCERHRCAAAHCDLT